MVTWAEDPSFKIEAGATDFSSDGLTAVVHRPENAISYTEIIANDYDGKNYISNIDAFTVIKVSYRYGAGGWTQVFEGVTERVGPRLDSQQTLMLTAYGYGRALRNTHCAGNYGNESEDPLLNTPHEIWDDIIDNQINKRYSGGANTGYAITKAKVAPAANPDINYLEGGYRTNFTVINDVLLSYQGYRSGAAGMHWFVDESNNLFINTIGAHENNATGWPTWWRTDQAGSTLVEGTDFLTTAFHKKINPDFSNSILLYCNLRKPGTDVWTEDGGPTWNSFNLSAPTPDYSAVQFVVGSHSLRMITSDAAIGYAWHPNNNAGWDLTRIGSPESIPTLNFYFWRDADVSAAAVRLCTTDRVNDYFETTFMVFWTDPSETWIHRSLNVGPYWKTKDEERLLRWATVGAADWADINSICFLVQRVGEANATMYIDDLHFAGKIIREAYNSGVGGGGNPHYTSSIDAVDEVQKVVRYDVAVDDSMKASDDTGTAAQLAYGELLTRQYIPTVGRFTTPLAEDALPGQLIHIRSDEYLTGGGGWRINADFRIKELIHSFTSQGAFTTWDVTSDVLHTFGVGFNDALSTYHKLIHTDPDMKNLQTTGLDPYVPRLTIDYP